MDMRRRCCYLRGHLVGLHLSEITQSIRAAAAHEAAATRHDERYEQQMKSAGASMYAAFTAALRSTPEYHGRQITDRTVLNLYQSSKPRPWWDKELLAAGVQAKHGQPDRERASRLIQWHVDPTAAQSRRAKHALTLAAGRKRLEKQGAGAAHGARAPRAGGSTVTRAAADRVNAAAHEGAHAGRDLESAQGLDNAAGMRESSRAEVLALIGRLQSKARRVEVTALADAIDVLEAVERDLDDALKAAS